MESMILVLTPRECADLLKGDLSVLVRKRFPKDYVGWVYIYVAKGKPLFVCKDSKGIVVKLHDSKKNVLEQLCANGKVVARFWCDKVEEINKITMYNRPYDLFETETLQPTELLKQSCLRAIEMTKYFMFSNLPKESAAIHVTKVEPFDKPKEIKEFYHHFTQKRCERRFSNAKIEIDDKTHGLRQPTKSGYEYVYPLTHAPTTYCYIEVDA